jgi:ABC-2 type transport system permease protein
MNEKTLHRETHEQLWLFQAKTALVVTMKNIRVYYLKPPVLIFGIIFPIFFFLAFSIGRSMPLQALAPGLISMALFFTASAVGPLVTPWEKTAKTYERLATSPASKTSILAGDLLSGAVFGIIFSVIPLAIIYIITRSSLTAPLIYSAGIVTGSLLFAALGVLLSAPSTESPSQIMMLSNLVRLPLIFISGVFIPIQEMPEWGKWIAPFSPLTYVSDLMRVSFGQSGYFPVYIDFIAICAFAVLFFACALFFHKRTGKKGM